MQVKGNKVVLMSMKKPKNDTQTIFETEISLIDRSKNWWKYAQKGNDDFDKFMFGWISFNILYNFISKKFYRKDKLTEVNRVKKSIEHFFDGENLWSEDLKNSINDLIDIDANIFYRISPHDEKWITTSDIIDEIKYDIKRNNNIDALANTYEIIYRVRCNLFHGDKSNDDERDIEVISLCWRVMNNSFPSLLKVIETS